MLGIGDDGVLHILTFGARGLLTWRTRRLRTDVAITGLIPFGDMVLACGADGAAYDLGPNLDDLRAVDLAGRGRTSTVLPQIDAATGELHLITDEDGVQSHVVIARRALTRRSRVLQHVPVRVMHLRLAPDHLVLIADGCIGTVPRDGEARATWVHTSVALVPADRGVAWILTTPR